MTTWSPGTPVALRGIAHNKVWIAHTVRVIEDTPDRLAVYLQPGAECKIPSGLIPRKYSGRANSGSRWDEQDGGAWQLTDWQWQHRSAVILLQPETYYAVLVFRSAETHEFEGWYINFQRPFCRTATTIDTLDLEIDLVIRPDLSYQWKDEDEYAAGVRRGSISAEDAAHVEQTRADVVRLVYPGSPLFDSRWPAWQPDPIWTPPHLPSDWQAVVSCA